MARKKVYICGYCKEQIDVENEDESTFFFIMKDRNRKCFHCDCFIDYYTSKKRRQPLTVEECNKKINEYRKFEIENENSIEKKESARNLLFNYIADMYDLSYIPPYFYSKLSNVFNGKYKGLSKPVPPEDLLDMWQQKRNYLLKNAEFQRRHDVTRGMKKKSVMAVGMLSNAGKSRYMTKLIAYIALVLKEKVFVLLNEMSVEEIRYALITTVINNPEFQELHGLKFKKKEKEFTVGLYKDNKGEFIYQKKDEWGDVVEPIEDYIAKKST